MPAAGHRGAAHSLPLFLVFPVWGPPRHLSPGSPSTHLMAQELFRPPGASRPLLSQGADAPCWGPGRTPLHGEPQSDASWPQVPGSWPAEAGNTPNTLLPPNAEGREALREAILYYSDSRATAFAVGG